ncbi:MAG: DNA adenine methylase [Spirochaetia bacterium]|nr:DNA adenine methylase [Spirochaetia bacterium]
MQKQTGQRLEGGFCGYPRAFSYSMDESEKKWFKDNIGTKRKLLDPTAGGGSIPFEGHRADLDVFANDLNPVAVTILTATVKMPSFKPREVIREYKRLKEEFLLRRENRLTTLFPSETMENILPTNWIWARTITCPYCKGLIPLSPNWRLAPGGTGVRLKPHTADGPGSMGRVCEFEIVEKETQQSAGTVKSGDATCPYPDCERVIDGGEVKRQAKAGNLGEQLYAIVYKERRLSYAKTGKAKEKWVRRFTALPEPKR